MLAGQREDTLENLWEKGSAQLQDNSRQRSMDHAKKHMPR